MLVAFFVYMTGILYLMALGMLSAYSLNYLYLTYLAWRYRNDQPAAPPLPSYPTVTVQLPVYNELYVAQRLIDAACQLNWPAESLEVQILDDSTDETTEIIQRVIAEQRLMGKDIKHIHRRERAGFKAGALQEGLQTARGEFIAIFDADFIPPPDFLQKTIPFFAEPDIAFVQTRWGYLNHDYSLLTKLQSMMLDVHFIVDQVTRSRAGYFFNFNGTAGVWRKAAIEAAGGWQCDTLTEDLDLSYRALLTGWRAIYLRDVVTKSELPVTIEAYRRQQHKWCKGSIQCTIKLLPQILLKPVGTKRKIQAIFHLTGYLNLFLLFTISILYPLTICIAKQSLQFFSFSKFSVLFGIATLAYITTFMFALVQKDRDRIWWKEIFAAPLIFLLGAGMMINALVSIGQALLKTKNIFERTPKYGIEKKEDSWADKQYKIRFNGLVKYEMAMAILNLCTALFACQHSNWSHAFFSSMFAGGLLLVAGLTIKQELQWKATARQSEG